MAITQNTKKLTYTKDAMANTMVINTDQYFVTVMYVTDITADVHMAPHGIVMMTRMCRIWLSSEY